MNKHTIGKWKKSAHYAEYHHPDGDNDYPCVEIDIPDEDSLGGYHTSAIQVWGKNCVANANLILASPDLLAALQLAFDIDYAGDFDSWVELAKAAIDKATGEA